MKNSSPTKPRRGRVNRAMLDAMTEEDIMRTSPPELRDIPDDFFDEGIVMPGTDPKEPISIRLDSDVLYWFRSKGTRYQTRINAVLRSYVNAMKRKAQR